MRAKRRLSTNRGSMPSIADMRPQFAGLNTEGIRKRRMVSILVRILTLHELLGLHAHRDLHIAKKRADANHL